MAEKRWHSIKQQHCDHVGCAVNLEVQLVLPSEYLPEQPPRIIGHRCSKGLQCSLFTKPSCVWAGTNPDYDPFLEN